VALSPLATEPLLTLIVAALFGVEPLTSRKLGGVLVAMAGLAIALISVASAPEAAWSGDLLMVAAALCLAICNVWSKPLIRRSGPLTFIAMMVGCGTMFLIVVSWMHGGRIAAYQFNFEQWLAVSYLGIVGRH
jgi:drug/metabolite transporter (DMT)-like permease